MQAEPMVVCRYGWRQILRLYQDHLEIDGAAYSLDKLLQVRPTYHRIMGIPSVRLDLRFKGCNVLLRGIAAVEDAHKIVSYLNGQLKTTPPTIHEVPTRYLTREDRAQGEARDTSRYQEQASRAENEHSPTWQPSFQEHSPIMSDYKVEAAKVPATPTKASYRGWSDEEPRE